MIQDGDDVSLSRDDLVFVTNGSITESSTYGSHDKPAPISKELGGSWSLWKNLAEQSNDFGHPEVFYDNLPEKSWFVSATATIKSPEIEPTLNVSPIVICMITKLIVVGYYHNRFELVDEFRGSQAATFQRTKRK